METPSIGRCWTPFTLWAQAGRQLQDGWGDVDHMVEL